MRLLINIPKEFEQHFQADRFEDSLHRLSADAHLLAGNYEQETAVMLIEAFASAIPVPPHGGLIDADVLCKVLQKNSEDEWNNKTAPFSWAYAYDCVRDTVENMPIIIPAEEE